MPRAYLRLDPHVYDRKVLGIDRHGAPIEGWTAYPTDALVAFFGVLALADQQSPRGHFRSERILRELLRGGDGRGARYARQVPLLVERGDLVLEPGGRLYVDGWHEWQEGDLTPPARIAAVARRRGEETDVSPGALRQRRYRERHGGVTRDASQVTSHGSDGDERHPVEAEAEAYSNSGGGVTEAEARASNGAPRELSLTERRENLTASVAAAQAIVDDPGTSPAAKKAAQHGIERGGAALQALPAEEPADEPPTAAAEPPDVSFDAPSPPEGATGA